MKTSFASCRFNKPSLSLVCAFFLASLRFSTHRVSLIVLSILSLSLSACGGSGGGDGSPQTSNADAVIPVTVSTTMNTPLALNPETASNLTSENLSVTLSTPPTSGRIENREGNLRYIPNNRFTGSDTLSFLVSDGTTQDTVNVQITIAARSYALLASSGFHNCVLDRTNTDSLQCWGRNTNFQAFVPETVNNNLTQVQTIALGRDQSCFLDNGSIQCWRGDNTSSGDIPSELSTMSFKLLTAQNRSFCAVDTSDQIHCWGENLDNPALLDSGSIPDDLSNISDIALSSEDACVISDGTLVCWGLTLASNLNQQNIQAKEIEGNNSGSLCIITPNDEVECYAEIRPNGLISPPADLFTTATGLSVSDNFVCAIDAGDNNSIKCSGDINEIDGNGGGSESIFYDLPQSVSNIPNDISGVTTIAAGNDYLCALTDSGVRCWGEQSEYEPLATPKTIVNPRKISLTHRFNDNERSEVTPCVLHDYGVTCLGAKQQVLPSLDATEALIDLAVGTQSSCVIGDSSGVSCASEDTEDSLLTLPTFTNPTQIDMALTSACALHNGNTILCWGPETVFPTGDTPSTTSIQNSIPQSLTGDVNALKLAPYSACIHSTEEVKCWGSLETNAALYTSQPSAASLSSLTISSEDACIQTNSGLNCWGSDEESQFSTLPLGLSTELVAIGAETACSLQNGELSCTGDVSLSSKIQGLLTGIDLLEIEEDGVCLNATNQMVCMGDSPNRYAVTTQ